MRRTLTLRHSHHGRETDERGVPLSHEALEDKVKAALGQAVLELRRQALRAGRRPPAIRSDMVREALAGAYRAEADAETRARR